MKRYWLFIYFAGNKVTLGANCVDTFDYSDEAIHYFNREIHSMPDIHSYRVCDSYTDTVHAFWAKTIPLAFDDATAYAKYMHDTSDIVADTVTSAAITKYDAAAAGRRFERLLHEDGGYRARRNAKDGGRRPDAICKS